MNRRRYLVLAGIVGGLAGCSKGASQPGPTDAHTASNTRTETQGKNLTKTPEPTETATVTETETPEPASTDEDLAREHIETAAERVAAGVVKWDELAGANSDMLGVTAEANTMEFSVSAIGNAADGVDDKLIAAEEHIVEGLHPIAPQIGSELVDDDVFLFDLTPE